MSSDNEDNFEGENSLLVLNPNNAFMFQTKQALIKSLASKYVDFLIIYKKYQKTNLIDEPGRNKVAKLIINELLITDVDRLLRKAEFEQLSNLIVEVFPTEVKETYFASSVGKVVRSTGKLQSALRNFRTSLHECGLIHKRRIRKSKQIAENVINIDICEKVKLSEEKLLENINDEKDLYLHWENSFGLRQSFVVDKGVSAYFSRYPCLKTEHIKNLIKFDAEKILRTLCVNLIANEYNFIKEMKVFGKAILKLANNMKTAEIKSLISQHDILKKSFGEESDVHTILGFQCLPYFFRVKNLKRKNNSDENSGSNRTSHSSCARRFLPIFESDSLAEEFYKSNSSGSPRVYLIGKLSDFPKVKAYVSIDSKKLEFINTLKAINFCIYSFFALSEKYPDSCSHLWVLVQQLVYKVNLDLDKTYEVSRSYSLKGEALNAMKEFTADGDMEFVKNEEIEIEFESQF